MTTDQIQLVKKSWKAFRGINPATLGDLFYSKLFSDNPSLRKMFPADIQQQNIKLVEMLNMIVIRLDRIDELTDDITAMAQRHIQYGTKTLHYKAVGVALLWTLQKGLGKDWNDEVSKAWAACYQLLADSMMKNHQLS